MPDYSSDTSRVSVVIPCFNCRPFVEETIASAFHQTLEPHQVIVIDDGSTDGTWEELQRLKAYRFPALQILTHAQRANRGPSATRQRGARAATGDYVAFLDGDDTFQPEKLAIQVQAMASHPEVVLCHSAIKVIDDRSRAESFEGYFRHNPRIPYELRKRKGYLHNNFINTSSALARTAALKSIDFEIPYRPNQYYEDWLCWCLLAQRGRFLYLDSPLTCYRVHAASTTSSMDKETYKLIRLHAKLESTLVLLARSRIGPYSIGVIFSVWNCLKKMLEEYRGDRRQ